MVFHHRACVFGVDPGPEKSAVVILAPPGSEREANAGGRPVIGAGNAWVCLRHLEIENQALVDALDCYPMRGDGDPLCLMPGSEDHVIVEGMTPYGDRISKAAMWTLVWSGRFIQQASRHTKHFLPLGLPRVSIKTHLLGKAKGGDTEIRSVLGDRYGGLDGWRGAVGRKSTPGPLYGLTGSHKLAALAVSVAYIDMKLRGDL